MYGGCFWWGGIAIDWLLLCCTLSCPLQYTHGGAAGGVRLVAVRVAVRVWQYMSRAGAESLPGDAVKGRVVCLLSTSSIMVCAPRLAAMYGACMCLLTHTACASTCVSPAHPHACHMGGLHAVDLACAEDVACC
jgi:hypothetical protein